MLDTILLTVLAFAITAAWAFGFPVAFVFIWRTYSCIEASLFYRAAAWGVWTAGLVLCLAVGIGMWSSLIELWRIN